MRPRVGNFSFCRKFRDGCRLDGNRLDGNRRAVGRSAAPSAEFLPTRPHSTDEGRGGGQRRFEPSPKAPKPGGLPSRAITRFATGGNFCWVLSVLVQMAKKTQAKKRRWWIGVSVGVVVLVAGAIAKARFVGDLHFRFGEAVDAPHPQATWPWQIGRAHV